MQYRDEKPGQIGGLQRTRGFTVDDGHTFCRVDQIKQEVSILVEIIMNFYKNLGLWGKHWISLSVRESGNQEKYIGFPEDWDTAEAMLEEISKEYKLDAKRMEGEAAIYGPKLDFMFKDALGRETQLATIQLDFAMPKRFELTYIDEKGEKQTPVMIHRAILGSFERFIMLLIEHYAGAFPLWLAPVQVTLLPIADRHNDYAEKVVAELREKGIRAEADTRSERLQAKIRDATLQKVPFMGIIGDKEIAQDAISVRKRNGEDLGFVEISSFIQQLIQDIDKKV
jgi:threonyl-tRNA synthetase